MDRSTATPILSPSRLKPCRKLCCNYTCRMSGEGCTPRIYKVKITSEDDSSSSNVSRVSEKESGNNFTSTDVEFYHLRKVAFRKILKIYSRRKENRSTSQENYRARATESYSRQKFRSSLLPSSSSSTALHIMDPLCHSGPELITNIYERILADTSTPQSSVLSESKQFETEPGSDTSYSEDYLSWPSTMSGYYSTTSSSSETSFFSLFVHSKSINMLTDCKSKTIASHVPRLTPTCNIHPKEKETIPLLSTSKRDQVSASSSNAFHVSEYVNTPMIRVDNSQKMEDLIQKKNLHPIFGFPPAVIASNTNAKIAEKIQDQQKALQGQKTLVEIHNLPVDVPGLAPNQVNSLEINVAKHVLKRQWAMENDKKNFQTKQKALSSLKRKVETFELKIMEVDTPLINKKQRRDLEISVKKAISQHHRNSLKISLPDLQAHSQKWHAHYINIMQAALPKVNEDIGNHYFKAVIPNAKLDKSGVAEIDQSPFMYSTQPLSSPGEDLCKKIYIISHAHASLFSANNSQHVEFTLSHCYHQHGRCLPPMEDTKPAKALDNKSVNEGLECKANKASKNDLSENSADIKMDHIPPCPQIHYKEPTLAQQMSTPQKVNIVRQPRTGHIFFMEKQAVRQVSLNIQHKCLQLLLGFPNGHAHFSEKNIPRFQLTGHVSERHAQPEVSGIARPLLSAENRDLEWHITQKKLHPFWGFPKLIKKSQKEFMAAPSHLMASKNDFLSYRIVIGFFSQPSFISEECIHCLERHLNTCSIQRRGGMPTQAIESRSSCMPSAPPIEEQPFAVQAETVAGAVTKLVRKQSLCYLPSAVTPKTNVPDTLSDVAQRSCDSLLTSTTTKKNSAMNLHLRKKALEIEMNMLPPKVTKSYMETHPAIKRHFGKMDNASGLTLKSRGKHFSHLGPRELHTIDWNIRHKHLLFVQGLPSLGLIRPRVPVIHPLAWRRDPSYESDQLARPQEATGGTEHLERHVQIKKLQHQWGLPKRVQESLEAHRPLPPNPLTTLHKYSTQDVVCDTDDLYVMSEETKRHLEMHIKKVIIENTCGVPWKVAESLAWFMPRAPSLQEQQPHAVRMPSPVLAIHPHKLLTSSDTLKQLGSIKSEAKSTSTTARELKAPLFSSLTSLTLERKHTLRAHCAKKILAIKTRSIPAIAGQSHKAMFPTGKRKLPKVITSGDKVLVVRARCMPFVEARHSNLIDTNILCKTLAFLLKLPSVYTQPQSNRAPETLYHLPMIVGSGTAIEITDVDTAFVQKQDRDLLDSHIRTKHLQHQLDFSTGEGYYIKASHPDTIKQIQKPQTSQEIQVTVNTERKEMKKGVVLHLEMHIKKQLIPQKSGIPENVLGSLAQCMPHGPPVEGLVQSETAAALMRSTVPGRCEGPSLIRNSAVRCTLTDKVKVEVPYITVLKRITPEQKKNMEFQMTKKSLQIRMLTTPTHTGVTHFILPKTIYPDEKAHQLRATFIPFMYAQSLHYIDMNIRQKHLTFLLRLPSYYMECLQKMMPKAPPLYAVISSNRSLVGPVAMDTPSLACPTRDKLERHIKHKGLQLWLGLPKEVRACLQSWTAPLQLRSRNVSYRKEDIGMKCTRNLPFITRETKTCLERHMTQQNLPDQCEIPQRLDTFMSWMPMTHLPDDQHDNGSEAGRDSFHGSKTEAATAVHVKYTTNDLRSSEGQRNAFWNKLTTDQLNELHFHFTKKETEFKLGAIPKVTTQSYGMMFLAANFRPLPKWIPPGERVFRARDVSLPFLKTLEGTSLDWNVQHKLIKFLWGFPNGSIRSLAHMFLSPPSLVQALNRRGFVIETTDQDLAFITKKMRYNLELHIVQRKLQHYWGVPKEVQKSLEVYMSTPCNPLRTKPSSWLETEIIIQMPPHFLPSSDTKQYVDIVKENAVPHRCWRRKNADETHQNTNCKGNHLRPGLITGKNGAQPSSESVKRGKVCSIPGHDSERSGTGVAIPLCINEKAIADKTKGCCPRFSPKFASMESRANVPVEIQQSLEGHFRQKTQHQLWGLSGQIEEPTQAADAYPVLLAGKQASTFQETETVVNDMSFVSHTTLYMLNMHLQSMAQKAISRTAKTPEESLSQFMPFELAMEGSNHCLELETGRRTWHECFSEGSSQDTRNMNTDHLEGSKRQKHLPKVDKQLNPLFLQTTVKLQIQILPTNLRTSFGIVKDYLPKFIHPGERSHRSRDKHIHSIEPHVLDHLDTSIHLKYCRFLWELHSMPEHFPEFIFQSSPLGTGIRSTSMAVEMFLAEQTWRNGGADARETQLQQWIFPFQFQHPHVALMQDLPIQPLMQIGSSPPATEIVPSNNRSSISDGKDRHGETYVSGNQKDVISKGVTSIWGRFEPQTPQVNTVQFRTGGALSGIVSKSISSKCTPKERDYLDWHVTKKSLETRRAPMPFVVHMSHKEAYSDEICFPVVTQTGQRARVLRPKFIPFVEPFAMKTLDKNIKQKLLTFLCGFPSITPGSLASSIPKLADPLWIVKPQRQIMYCTCRELPFLSETVMKTLESNIGERTLHLHWGLPSLVQNSIEAYMHPPTKFLKSSMNTGIRVIVNTVFCEVSFLAEKRRCILETHIKKWCVQRIYGMPTKVADSINRFISTGSSHQASFLSYNQIAKAACDTLKPIHDESSTSRISEQGVANATHDTVYGRLTFQGREQLLLHMTKKSLEIKLSITEAVIQMSHDIVYADIKRSLPRLIQPGEKNNQGRAMDLPYVMPDVRTKIDTNMKHKYLRFLWHFPELPKQPIPVGTDSAKQQGLPSIFQENGRTSETVDYNRELLENQTNEQREWHIKSTNLQYQVKWQKKNLESVPSFTPSSEQHIQPTLRRCSQAQGVAPDRRLYFISKKTKHFIEAHKKEIMIQNPRGLAINAKKSYNVFTLISLSGVEPSKYDSGFSEVGSPPSSAMKCQSMTNSTGKMCSNTVSSQATCRMERHCTIKCLEIKADVMPALVQWSHKAASSTEKSTLPKPDCPVKRVLKVRAKFFLYIEQEALKCIRMNIKYKYLWHVWSLPGSPTDYVDKVKDVNPCLLPPAQANTGRLATSDQLPTSVMKQTQKKKLDGHIRNKRTKKKQGGFPVKVQKSTDVCVPPAPVVSKVKAYSEMYTLVSTGHLYFIRRETKQLLESHIANIATRQELPCGVRGQSSFGMVTEPSKDGGTPSQNVLSASKVDRCACSERRVQHASQAAKTSLALLPEPMFVRGMLKLTQRNRLQKHLMKKCLEIKRDGIPPLAQWSHKLVYETLTYVLPKLLFPGQTAPEVRAECVLFIEQEALKRVDKNIQLKHVSFCDRSPMLHDGSDEKMISDEGLNVPEIVMKPFMPPSSMPPSPQSDTRADSHRAPDTSRQRTDQEWFASARIRGMMSEKSELSIPSRLPLKHEFTRHDPMKPLPNINNKWQIKAFIDLHLKRRVEHLHSSSVSNNLPNPKPLNKLISAVPYPTGHPGVTELAYNRQTSTRAVTPRGMFELTTILDIHLKKKLLEDYFGIPHLVQKSRILANPPVAPSLAPQKQELMTERVLGGKNELESSMINSKIPHQLSCTVTNTSAVLPLIDERRVDKVHIKSELEFGFKKIVLRLLLGFQCLETEEVPVDLKDHSHSCHCTCLDYPYRVEKLSKHASPPPIAFPKLEILEMCPVVSLPLKRPVHMDCRCDIQNTANAHETHIIKKYSVVGAYLPCFEVTPKKANEMKFLRNMTRDKNTEQHLLLRSVRKMSAGNQTWSISEHLNVHLKQKIIMHSCGTPLRVIESREIHECYEIQERREVSRKMRVKFRNNMQQKEGQWDGTKQISDASHLANIRRQPKTICCDEELGILSEAFGFFRQKASLPFPYTLKPFFTQYHSLDIEQTSGQINYSNETLSQRALANKSQCLCSSFDEHSFQLSLRTTLHETSSGKNFSCSSHSSHIGKNPIFYVYPPYPTAERYAKANVCCRVPQTTSEGMPSRTPLNIEEKRNDLNLVNKKLESCSWQTFSYLRPGPPQKNIGYQSQEKAQYITVTNRSPTKTRLTSKRQAQPYVHKIKSRGRSYMQAWVCGNCSHSGLKSQREQRNPDRVKVRSLSISSGDVKVVLLQQRSNYTPAAHSRKSTSALHDFAKKGVKPHTAAYETGSHQATFKHFKSLKRLIPLSYKRIQKWYENVKFR